MFVAGISLYSAMIFSIVQLPGCDPVGDQGVQLDRDDVQSFDFVHTPMLYAFGFIGLFTMGGLTGLFLAALGVDVHVTRHLFRHRAFPLHHGGRHGHGVSGRAALLVAEDHRPNVSRGWGKLAALIVFLGFNLTFFPQFILGYLGMPRRYGNIRRSFRC